MTDFRSPLASVFTQGRYAGAILSRGKCGYEAVDVNERSIGFFASQAEAAAALQGMSIHALQDGDTERDLVVCLIRGSR